MVPNFAYASGASPSPSGLSIYSPDPGVPLGELVRFGPMDVWRTQPSVRKVVDFAARNMASIPWHLYARVSDTNRQRVGDTALATLLRKPGPLLTPYRLWHRLYVDLLLWDRWAVVKIRHEDGRPPELLRVPPSRFRLLGDAMDQVTGIRVWDGLGKAYDLGPDMAAFDFGYGAGVNGTPPIDTLGDLLAESAAGVQYRRDIYANGAQYSAVIERPVEAGKWDDATWERFRRSFAEYRAGGAKAGGTPILEDGMTLKPQTGFTAADLQLMEARSLTDVEVASAYHIPPEMVGARAGTYSNIESYRQNLYRDALGPTIVATEQVINLFLVPWLGEGDESLYVEAHLDAKLRGAWETQAAILQTATGAPYMTRNEARARLNMPPVAEGDSLVTPLNVLVGGQASPTDSAPKGIEGRRAVRVGRKAERPYAMGDEDTERAAFGKALDRAWADMAERVAAALGVDLAKTAVALDEAFDLPAEVERFRSVLLPWFTRLAAVGAWSVLDQFNPEADGWSAEVMLAWLNEAARGSAESLGKAAHAGLVEAVRAPAETAGALGSFLASRRIPTALAQQFAGSVIGFGKHDAASASGVNRKTWRTVSNNARPSHKRLDGETVDAGETFSNGLRWPGDHGGDQDETAGCTCRITYGVE